MAGKYIIQYIFGAASSAAVQPLLDSIGIGWTFMICKFCFLLDTASSDADSFRCVLLSFRGFIGLGDHKMGA